MKVELDQSVSSPNGGVDGQADAPVFCQGMVCTDRGHCHQAIAITVEGPVAGGDTEAGFDQ